MLTVHQIDRHFKARRFELLLRGVAPVGMPLAMPLVVRLSDQPAAVIALALKRVVELTYGDHPLRNELLAALLALQNADGSFGSAGGIAPAGDPLATAAAVAAINALLIDSANAPHPEAAVARERAIAALAANQADDGLFCSPLDRAHDDRALTGAFVLAMVAGDDDFRHAVQFASLMSWFEEHEEMLDGPVSQLWRIGQLDGAQAA